MSQTSLTRLWSVRMTNSAVLARSQTSCDVLLSLSGNLCQTSVGNPLTFTANLPKEQLMMATGRTGCFYMVPFKTITHFHTKPLQFWSTGQSWSEISMRKLSLRHALAWSVRRLLYTPKYNTRQPARILWRHDEEWVKLCSSLSERTPHWCQQSTGE